MGKRSAASDILKMMAEAIRKLTGFNPDNWEQIVEEAIKEVRAKLKEE